MKVEIQQGHLALIFLNESELHRFRALVDSDTGSLVFADSHDLEGTIEVHIQIGGHCPK